MVIIVVALPNGAAVALLWPQLDGRFLLGAWTLAVGDCALAPYLATGLRAWRWRRLLADPRVSPYEHRLAQFARDSQGAGLLGRALLGSALCTVAALAGAGTLLAYPEARETARLATAGAGVLIGLWAVWSALRA